MKLFRYAIIGLFLFLGGVFVGGNVSAQSSAFSDFDPSSVEVDLSSGLPLDGFTDPSNFFGVDGDDLLNTDGSSLSSSTLDQYEEELALLGIAGNDDISSLQTKRDSIDTLIFELEALKNQSGIDTDALIKKALGVRDQVEVILKAFQSYEEEIDSLDNGSGSLTAIRSRRDKVDTILFELEALEDSTGVTNTDLKSRAEQVLGYLEFSIEFIEQYGQSLVDFQSDYNDQIDSFAPAEADTIELLEGKEYELDTLIFELEAMDTRVVHTSKDGEHKGGFYIGRHLAKAKKTQKSLKANMDYLPQIEAFLPTANDTPESLYKKYQDLNTTMKLDVMSYAIDNGLLDMTTVLHRIGEVNALLQADKRFPVGEELPEQNTAGLSSQTTTSPVSLGPSRGSGVKLPPGYQPYQADANNRQPVFDGDGLTRGSTWVKLATSERISKEQSLPKLIAAWLRFALSVLVVLAVIAIIYAGVMYVTGGGDDSRYTTARQIVIWVVIGLLVVLGAYAFVNTLIGGFVDGV